MSPDLTLVIETSIGCGSISLWETERLLKSEVSTVEMGRSEDLLARIDGLFKGLEFSIRDVERIVCSKGPGGYTGLRVGLATADGLARALQKDLYAYSNVDVLLSMARPGEAAAAVLDAGRDSYLFCAEGEDGLEISIVGSIELCEHALALGINAIIAAVSKYEGLLSVFENQNIEVRNASGSLNPALYKLFRQKPELGRDLNPVYGRELEMRGGG